MAPLLFSVFYNILLVHQFFHLVLCIQSPLNPKFLLKSSPTSIVLPLLSSASTTKEFLPKNSTSRVHVDYNVSLVVAVMVGTPPQKVLMVMDTGSELSWLQCASNATTNTSLSSFNPSLSNSYSNISCTSPECTTQTRDFPTPTTCDDSNLCHFTYSYADGTGTQGNMGRDTFTITTSFIIPDVVFGCVDSSFLSNTSSENGQPSSGILGLNRGALSFIQQMGNNVSKKFSYCIADPVRFPSSSGVLVVGESPYNASSLQYTSMIMISTPLPYFNRAAYTVKLEGIKVGGKKLAVPKSVFLPDHTGAGQTMIDSGTQFTFLLGTAYNALKREFLLQTQAHNLSSKDISFQGVLDLCYSLPKQSSGVLLLPKLPIVTLVFDSAQVELKGNQLLYEVGNGNNNDTVFCFTFGNSDLLPVEANIIGNHHQQNLWLEYDLENSRIGFAPAECNMDYASYGTANR